MTGNTARMKTDTKLRKMDKAFFSYTMWITSTHTYAYLTYIEHAYKTQIDTSFYNL